MTERSRAFLTDLEREAGLPHGTLSERLLPQFAADDPRLDQIGGSELGLIAQAFTRGLAQAGFRSRGPGVPLTPEEIAQVQRGIVLAGRAIDVALGRGIIEATADIIRKVCPYCPDDIGGGSTGGGTGGAGGAGGGGTRLHLPREEGSLG